MSRWRFVSIGLCLGIGIPTAWLVIYWTFLRDHAGMISPWQLRVLLNVWPSWAFLMADPEERSMTIPALSIAINALLYGIGGWSIWFGLNRNRFALFAVVVVVVIGSYSLQRWLSGWT
jgi:hypothetical protein